MRVDRYPFDYPIEKNFPNKRDFAGAEGGSVLMVEKDAQFYIIVDESGWADFEELRDELVGVYEFDTEAERQAYIVERGWDKLADHYKETGLAPEP